MDYDQTAKEMAKNAGYVGALRTDLTYKGFTIFDPIEPTAEGENPAIGMPMFILAKGDSIRWTRGDECFDVLDLIIERDGPDEDEIDEESELDKELAAIEEQEKLMSEPETEAAE